MFGFISRAIFAVSRAESEIVTSLEVEPQNWKFDCYWATHTTGLRVWISNGSTFIRIEANPDDWKPSWSERVMIWNAVKHLKKQAEKQQAKKIRASVKKHLAKLGHGE